MDKFIVCIVSFGCAILFFSIGVYAQKLKKPMWFWSGVEVDSSKIRNIAQYNKENGVMWKLYSLWYFASGLTGIWSLGVSAIILALSCTLGLVLLIISYNKIYKKYTIE